MFPQELNLKGAYSHQNAPGRSKCLGLQALVLTRAVLYALVSAGVFVGGRLVPIDHTLREAWVWVSPKSTSTEGGNTAAVRNGSSTAVCVERLV